VLTFDVDGANARVRATWFRGDDTFPVAKGGLDGHQHLQLRVPGRPERWIVGVEDFLLLNRRRGDDLPYDPITWHSEAETWVAGAHEERLCVHLIPFG
jgi:hypothetical protein